MRQAELHEPARCWSEVTVLLLDDAQITQVNTQYFHKHRPTDVISFAYPPIHSHQRLFSGDILVNVQRAMEEGMRRGDPSLELALYLAHGCLHIAGEEDETRAQRARMRRHEKKLLVHYEGLALFRDEPVRKGAKSNARTR